MTVTDRLNGQTGDVAIKAPCRVATTANITLSGLQTIDGVALAALDRVLVKNQTNGVNDGIYHAASGDWVRAPDFNGSRDAYGGAIVHVTSGTTNANSFWVLDGEGEIDIGTDSIDWLPSSGNIDLQASLLATSGAALVGASHAQSYNAGTLGDKFKRFICITDAPYNGVGDDSTDNAAAFTAALAAISAAGGGTLWVPEGTFRKTGNHALPENTSLIGAGFRASSIKQMDANFAFDFATGCEISNLVLTGTSTATGAIDATLCRFGVISNIEVTGFTGTGAVALKQDDTIRLTLITCYFFTNYTHLSFANECTTFRALGCNFSVTNASGYAISADTGGVTESLEAKFYGCYFESCYGANPILAGMSGRLDFDGCGFEAMCNTAGHVGTVANPRVIRVNNPCQLSLRDCTFSGFQADLQAFSGTANFIYLGDDAQECVLDNVILTQNVSATSSLGASAYEIQYIRQAGTETVLSLNNVRTISGGFASALTAEIALTAGLDITSGTRWLNGNGNRVTKPGSASRAYYKRPPIAANDATAVTSGTTLTTLFTITLPRRGFRAKDSLRLKVFGGRAGTADVKQLSVALDAGGSTSLNVGGAITTATDWHFDIVIKFLAYNSQAISIFGADGSTAFADLAVMTKDTSANDLVLTFSGQCTNGADSITLYSADLERL